MADNSNFLTKSILDNTLDDLYQSLPIGSINSSISNNLYGINHRQVRALIPTNKEVYGFTFFVKPQLNLTSNNIRNLRLLYPLLNNNKLSVQTVVRGTLDPRIVSGYSVVQNVYIEPPLSCILIDPLQAFIPILTNDIVSISGGQDLALPTFTSKEGLYGQVYSQVDGIARYYGVYDIDVTFTNMRGDVIFYLFYSWLHYQANVFEGKLLPYPDFNLANEIDYMTRIYRIILDRTKTTVTKIFATGVCYPYTLPMAQFFDFNIDRPYNEQVKDITIRFKCLGFESVDDILVFEFNETVCQFNPGMRDQYRNEFMTKIDNYTATIFKNRGYPRIDPNNYNLEWFVFNNLFTERSKVFSNNNNLINKNLDSYQEQPLIIKS